MQRSKRQPRRLAVLMALSTALALPCCDMNTDDREIDAVSPGLTQQGLVEFTYFSGTSVEGGVLLAWGTRTETNSAGFNLFRKKTSETEFELINETLIASKSPEGAEYEYLDQPLDPGSYNFKMEEVDSEGTATPHGGSFTVTVFGDGDPGDDDPGDGDPGDDDDQSETREDDGDRGGDCSAVVSPMGSSRSLAMLFFAACLDS